MPALVYTASGLGAIATAGVDEPAGASSSRVPGPAPTPDGDGSGAFCRSDFERIVRVPTGRVNVFDFGIAGAEGTTVAVIVGGASCFDFAARSAASWSTG